MTDVSIVEGLTRGDAATFDFLYRKYGPRILSYVLKNNGTREDGSELIHTTLLKIWENIQKGRYQLTNSRFEAYFFTIATNLWIDELRYRKNRTTETIDNWQFIDESTTDLQYKKATDRRLTLLSEVLESWTDSICKAIIVAFHIENISLLDIAAQQGWDYNNAKKRIFDCRKRLARLAQMDMDRVEEEF